MLGGLAATWRKTSVWHSAWLAAFVLFALFDIARFVATIRLNVLHPPLWDFKVFWMVGHVAAGGHNIYDPASYLPYRALTNPGGDREFDSIALGIGMPYPPPAILLFYPLGFTGSIAASLALWSAFVFASVALAIGLLSRTFFATSKAEGVVAATVLVVALPATALTLALLQLDFLVLCLLVPFWRERNAWRAGLWLAPMLVLRPFLVIVAVYFVARRQWNTLVSAVAALATLFLVSIPFVGWNGLLSYFRANPSARYPQSYFSGFASLYEIVSKFDRRATAHFSILGHPIFAIAALTLILASFFVCLRAGGARRDACLAFLVALGLFLYPNTGAHYAVLLLAPLCVLWSRRHELRVGTAGALGFLTLEYVLMTFGETTVGLVSVLAIALFGTLALRGRVRSGDAADGAMG